MPNGNFISPPLVRYAPLAYADIFNKLYFHQPWNHGPTACPGMKSRNTRTTFLAHLSALGLGISYTISTDGTSKMHQKQPWSTSAFPGRLTSLNTGGKPHRIPNTIAPASDPTVTDAPETRRRRAGVFMNFYVYISSQYAAFATIDHR